MTEGNMIETARSQKEADLYEPRIAYDVRAA